MKRISLTWLPVVFHRRYDWLKVMQTCGLRIFSQNKENILTVLDTYIEKLQEFKKHIADYDEKGVKDLIHKANKIKRIIR